MENQDTQNEPIWYVVIKQSKRSKNNEDANKHRFIDEHNHSKENNNENEIAEPQILSIKDLYGKKSLLDLKKETSAKFLGSDQHGLLISEIGLAFESFNVSFEGNYSVSHYAIMSFITINSSHRRQMHIIESKSKDSNIPSAIEKSLRNRRKLKHFTHNQLVWIYHQLKMKKQTENEIMDKYEISSSTIRRIMRSKGVRDFKYKLNSITTYSEWLSSVRAMELIESYIKRNKVSFTALDIWRKFSEELHITISPHVVRRVLKEWFALSYKKGSDRPSSLDIEKQNWLMAIFWLHFVENLNSFKLVVNVDGWVLTRSIKQRYSWLEKGKSCKVYSSQYKGRISLFQPYHPMGQVLLLLTHQLLIQQSFKHLLITYWSSTQKEQ